MRMMLAFPLALAWALSPLAATAQERQGGLPAPPTVSVTGQGTITRAPDQATLGLAIVTNNDSAATATSQNNATYNALRSRLGAIGIAESAIHTRSFNINFVPKPADNVSYKPPRTGYIVTRSLDVTLNDIGAVGRTIDAAVAAGVTDVSNVSFGLRDRRGAYAAALAAAMRDAEAQAQALAEAGHMHLGGIRSINTSGYVPPRPLQMMARVAAGPAPNVPTEVQPSDIDVSATVNVSYLLR